MLRLLATADVAMLGGRHCLFDRGAQHESVICIPTQRVSLRLFELIRRLKRLWPTHEPQTRETLLIETGLLPGIDVLTLQARIAYARQRGARKPRIVSLRSAALPVPRQLPQQSCCGRTAPLMSEPL